MQIRISGCKDIRLSTIFQQLFESKFNGPKHTFYFWTACLNRLSTIDRVGNHLQITNQNVCNLHRNNEESHHIFYFTAHIEDYNAKIVSMAGNKQESQMNCIPYKVTAHILRLR